MKDTTISCADHTFEPWRAHEERRIVLSESDWKDPERWNRQAGEDQSDNPHRPRVFCASLADVFEDWQGPMHHHNGKRLGTTGSEPWVAVDDDPGYDWVQGLTMQHVRNRLFRLIDATPNLDWLLLTKRAENIRKMWPAITEYMPKNMQGLLRAGAEIKQAHRANIWLGTSISDQATANEQIPQLLECRNLAPVLFLSFEPLLGPIDFRRVIASILNEAKQRQQICPSPGHIEADDRVLKYMDAIFDWVIVGGESGPDARICNLEWIRSIVDQCRRAGVPCWVKQLGSNVVELNRSEVGPLPLWERLYFTDKKAADPSEWPEDLRVQQLPHPERAIA